MSKEEEFERKKKIITESIQIDGIRKGTRIVVIMDEKIIIEKVIE